MEGNEEKKVNTEELKSEASNTVNQVKDTIKTVDIKKDSIETKGFVTDICEEWNNSYRSKTCANRREIWQRK